MSITKKLVVTLKDDVATPSERIFIYKGDVGVDIIIELENFNYKIDSISEKNMINRIEAYFKTPQGIVKQYNDEVDVLNGDRIKFSFSKNVINDMQIIGQYELQFHLFDKEDNRITIPSYYFYVKEPLHNTSEEQEDDESRVDYARVDYSKVKDDIVLFEVFENGYIKTNWQSGDLITSTKLNKIEAQLEINTNKINEMQPYDDTEINNSLNKLSESIKNLNIPTKTSELENDSDFVTNTELDSKGYLTEHQDISGKVDKVDGKSLISDTEIERLANVNNYDDTEIKEELNNKANLSDLHQHSNKEVLDGISEEKITSWDNKSDFSGNYNDLSNKPSIPTKTSQLTNDNGFLTSVPSEYITETELEAKGYLTEHQSLSSYATKDDLNTKVDKIEGKGLSSNDYTDEEKNKLNNIEEGANNYIHPTKHEASIIIEDSEHRFVTDEEKSKWSNKSEFSGSYNDLTNKPNIPIKTSELVNDSTYVTENGVLEIIENSSEISQGETEPTEESVLLWIDTDEDIIENNLSNSLKSEIQDSISTLNTRVSSLEKIIETPFGEDAHTHSNKVVLDKITQAYFDKWNNKSDFNGSYNSLTNKPTIPTRTSELINDSKYVTTTEMNEAIADISVGGGVNLTNYQTKTDNTLNTTDKTVVGAINEINTNLGNKINSSEVDTKISSYITEHKAELKGDKGEDGKNGQDGADGLTTSISVNGATYTHTDGLITLPNYPTVPTKTSELTNDSSYATETYVETKIAETSLSGGEIDLSGYATKDDLNTKEDKVIGKGLSTNDLTNELKSNYNVAYTHSQSTHAPNNAQKNSDITKGEIEAKLIGNITTHTHNQYLTEHQDISGLATKTELNNKVDKIDGMGLSANDYTTEEKDKLDGIEEGANNYTHPTTHNATMITQDSTHRFVTDTEKSNWNAKSDFSGNYNDLTNKPTIPNAYVHPSSHSATMITEDSTHRFVTDTEKSTWNNKSDFSGSYNDLKNKPTIPTVTNDLTNELKANYDTAYTHSQSTHAPINAQKNSDITKTEIEAKLIGNITTHTHSQYLTEHQDISNLATKDELNTKANSSDIPTSLPANGGNADTIDNFHIWKGTQAQYNAISSKDSNTIYIIVG